MRAISITICAASILGVGAAMFITGRFDLAVIAIMGSLFAYFAWAIWDDMD